MKKELVKLISFIKDIKKNRYLFLYKKLSLL